MAGDVFPTQYLYPMRGMFGLIFCNSTQDTRSRRGGLLPKIEAEDIVFLRYAPGLANDAVSYADVLKAARPSSQQRQPGSDSGRAPLHRLRIVVQLALRARAVRGAYKFMP